MIRLAVAGLSLGLTLAPVAAMAQVDSRAGAPPVAGMPAGPGPMMRRMPPPPMQTPGGARWSQVPGGWNAYHRPSYGYTLPRYWIAPSFYISDWSSLGLPAPAPGFGWSHYYDDTVLTDRWGRVYDWRDGRDAGDGHEDYSDSYGYRDDANRGAGYPRRPRRNDGVAGAVAGAVVGGVAGNVIAGHGNRLAGSLIGGGVGALAGQAIDRSVTHDRRQHDTYERGYDRYQSYGAPHWDDGYREQRKWGPSYGYSYGGDGGGTTVTTVFIDSAPSQPVVTRSVSYVTEYVSVPVRHRVVHHWKPRARPSCVCGS